MCLRCSVCELQRSMRPGFEGQYIVLCVTAVCSLPVCPVLGLWIRSAPRSECTERLAPCARKVLDVC